MLNSLHDENDRREDLVDRARGVAEAERQVLVDAIAGGEDPVTAIHADAVAVVHAMGPVLRDGYLLGVEVGTARAKR